VVYPGTGYTLSRLHGPGMGLYLAMTAHAIPVQEAVAAGVLSHPLEALADISLVTEVLAATSEVRRHGAACPMVLGASVLSI
jgi:enoyl-CoA hydratase/carnithine racemase